MDDLSCCMLHAACDLPHPSTVEPMAIHLVFQFVKIVDFLVVDVYFKNRSTAVDFDDCIVCF